MSHPVSWQLVHSRLLQIILVRDVHGRGMRGRSSGSYCSFDTLDASRMEMTDGDGISCRGQSSDRWCGTSAGMTLSFRSEMVGPKTGFEQLVRRVFAGMESKREECGVGGGGRSAGEVVEGGAKSWTCGRHQNACW